MRRTGEDPRPLIGAGLASLIIHLVALWVPFGGGGPLLKPRAFTPQPPLPVIEASIRTEVAVAVAMPLPAEPGEPSAEPPPPQVIVDVQPAALDLADLHGDPSEFPAYYFRPSEISDPPYPLTVAPIDIDDRGVGPSGVVFSIEVLIDETGNVDGIALHSGSVPAAVWSQVEREFGKTSYRPGRLYDKPVKSRLRIELSIPPAAKP